MARLENSVRIRGSGNLVPRKMHEYSFNGRLETRRSGVIPNRLLSGTGLFAFHPYWMRHNWHSAEFVAPISR